MIDKDFEKYIEKKRKCKGYYYNDKVNAYKYFTQIEYNGNRKTFTFLNAEDAKWAYLKFHEILYKEDYEKGIFWLSNYNQEYKKDYIKKYLDNLKCEWRYVNDSNKKYIVTEYGDIHSLYDSYGKKMNLKKNMNGYNQLNININEKKITVLSHSLVANAFLEKPNKENLVVDHIDRNKLNNHYSNLRWVSIRENTINSDLMDNAKGYYKMRNFYLASIHFLGENIRKSFSSEKDARNFYLKHRKNLNSLSENKGKQYLKNLKLEIKKERLKKTKGYYKNYNKYVAKINYNKQHINLGSFKTEKEARQAYLDAVEKYHGIKIEE